MASRVRPSATSVCVAPNRRASGIFAGWVSTAMIVDAPHSAAPCTMFNPTPPQPNTTTLSPGRTPAVYIAAPTPVATAHPTSAAAFRGASRRTGMQLASGTTAYSAKLARPQ